MLPATGRSSKAAWIQDQDDEDVDRWIHEQIRKGVGGSAAAAAATQRQPQPSAGAPAGVAARRPLAATAAPAQHTAAVAAEGEAVLASLSQGLHRLQVGR